MKCYIEVEIDEDIKTAEEIGDIYNINARHKETNKGHRVSSFIRRYLDKNNIEIKETYVKKKNRLVKAYSKDVYEKVVEYLKDNNML